MNAVLRNLLCNVYKEFAKNSIAPPRPAFASVNAALSFCVEAEQARQVRPDTPVFSPTVVWGFNYENVSDVKEMCYTVKDRKDFE